MQGPLASLLRSAGGQRGRLWGWARPPRGARLAAARLAAGGVTPACRLHPPARCGAVGKGLVLQASAFTCKVRTGTRRARLGS